MCVYESIDIPYSEEDGDFHIDVAVINSFHFSKNLNKRKKQDILLKNVVSRVEALCGYEMINVEYNSFEKLEHQQFFFSIPTESREAMSRLCGTLENILNDHNLLRLYKVWMD